ncbi:hypothetical protein GCM10009540_73030 [Streptomyces turgidiscabies]
MSYTHMRWTPPLLPYRSLRSRFHGFCMAYVNAVFVQPSVGDAADAAEGAAEDVEDAEAVDRVVDQTAPEASKPPAASTVRLDGVMGMPNNLSGDTFREWRFIGSIFGRSVGLDQIGVNNHARFRFSRR